MRIKRKYNSPQLGSSYNSYNVIDNKSCCNLDNKDILREVTIKIELKRSDTQKEVIVKALLDNGITELVISLEFSRKQRFKLKK